MIGKANIVTVIDSTRNRVIAILLFAFFIFFFPIIIIGKANFCKDASQQESVS
jgi:hypothetical protein